MRRGVDKDRWFTYYFRYRYKKVVNEHGIGDGLLAERSVGIVVIRRHPRIT